MRVEMPLAATEPPRDCPLCPRLVAYREELRRAEPGWWNAPVPAWGDPQAWLAIVGLAPGRRGANRTGRPFTGDDAGDFLFAALAEAGLTRGTFDRRADDGFELIGAMILNAVKCLPPQNKPLPQEIASCGRFLAAQLDALPTVRVVLALGRIAHDAVLRDCGLTPARHRFAHGAEHALPGGRMLLASYHCSRQNTRTGRLTPAMFAAVIERAKAH
ncbi:MAG: uracil-DNA glycosylase [Croceibacterium sp.]